jgi:hypothetical protein
MLADTTGTYSHTDQHVSLPLSWQIVVVEEAGEVLEAHLLACLSRHSEHLLLIGDHEQLRPKVERWELQAESRRGHDLDVSLFERLVVAGGFPREVGGWRGACRRAVCRGCCCCCCLCVLEQAALHTRLSKALRLPRRLTPGEERQYTDTDPTYYR